MTWTLARASFDGALIVGAVWLLTCLIRLSPATRTVLWWCAAAKFLLALVWTTPLELPVLPAPPVHTTFVAPMADAAIVAPARSAAIDVEVTQADLVWHAMAEWASFAVIAWTAGLCLVALVALRRWRETSRLLAQAVVASADVQQRAGALAARLGLKRAPEVRISDAVQTPLVAGLRRPVIVLPAERFASLTSRQQEMAICHELTHVKRADLWLGCVPALTERLFFFHPLAHLVSREYSLAREAACDAAVVETLDAAPREYGCLLLALGVSRPQAGAAAGAAWSFLHLKRRIAMLQEFSSRTTRSRAIAAAVVGAAVLALVPLRLVARPAAPHAGTHASVVAARGPETAVPARHASPSSLPELTAQERVAHAEPYLKFVLIDEGQQTVSGSTQELELARRHQRDGEPLLWFEMDGREYVIRDRDVIREAREAWRSFNGKHLEGLVSGEHLDAMRQLGVDSTIAAEAGAFGAQMGAMGAQIGAMAGGIVADVLKDFHLDLSSLDSLKELHHLKDLEQLKDLQFDVEHQTKDIDKDVARFQKDLAKDLEKSSRDVAKAMREIHEQIRNDLHHSLKRELRDEIDHHRHEIDELKDRLRELEGPIRDMTEPLKDLAEPLAEIGRHMGDVGREIGDNTRDAMEEMRAIIERALKSGRAQSVR
jgi:beta-lactamase regulating signal transducer with metallopeptidase domain